jgi:hypothetical protein
MRINRIPELGLCQFVGKIHFSEHIWAIQKTIIGSQQDRNTGFNQIPNGWKWQAEYGIGPRINDRNGPRICQ